MPGDMRPIPIDVECLRKQVSSFLIEGSTFQAPDCYCYLQVGLFDRRAAYEGPSRINTSHLRYIFEADCRDISRNGFLTWRLDLMSYKGPCSF